MNTKKTILAALMGLLLAMGFGMSAVAQVSSLGNNLNEFNDRDSENKSDFEDMIDCRDTSDNMMVDVPTAGCVTSGGLGDTQTNAISGYTYTSTKQDDGSYSNPYSGNRDEAEKLWDALNTAESDLSGLQTELANAKASIAAIEALDVLHDDSATATAKGEHKNTGETDAQAIARHTKVLTDLRDMMAGELRMGEDPAVAATRMTVKTRLEGREAALEDTQALQDVKAAIAALSDTDATNDAAHICDAAKVTAGTCTAPDMGANDAARKASALIRHQANQAMLEAVMDDPNMDGRELNKGEITIAMENEARAKANKERLLPSLVGTPVKGVSTAMPTLDTVTSRTYAYKDAAKDAMDKSAARDAANTALTNKQNEQTNVNESIKAIEAHNAVNAANAEIAKIDAQIAIDALSDATNMNVDDYICTAAEVTAQTMGCTMADAVANNDGGRAAALARHRMARGEGDLDIKAEDMGADDAAKRAAAKTRLGGVVTDKTAERDAAIAAINALPMTSVTTVNDIPNDADQGDMDDDSAEELTAALARLKMRQEALNGKADDATTTAFDPTIGEVAMAQQAADAAAMALTAANTARTNAQNALEEYQVNWRSVMNRAVIHGKLDHVAKDTALRDLQAEQSNVDESVNALRAHYAIEALEYQEALDALDALDDTDDTNDAAHICDAAKVTAGTCAAVDAVANMDGGKAAAIVRITMARDAALNRVDGDTTDMDDIDDLVMDGTDLGAGDAAKRLAAKARITKERDAALGKLTGVDDVDDLVVADDGDDMVTDAAKRIAALTRLTTRQGQLNGDSGEVATALASEQESLSGLMSKIALRNGLVAQGDFNNDGTNDANPIGKFMDELMKGEANSDDMVEAMAGHYHHTLDNRRDIEVNRGDIATNRSAIAANLTRIRTNAADIATNRNLINGLQQDVKTIRSGVAAALAVAGMPAPPSDGWGFAVGTGHFDGESAFSAGLSYKDDESNYKISIGTSGGETTFSAGGAWSF